MKIKISFDASTQSSFPTGSRLIDGNDVSDASLVEFYNKAKSVEEIPGLINDLNEIINENDGNHFLFRLRNLYYNLDEIQEILKGLGGNDRSILQILFLGTDKPLLIQFESQKMFLNSILPASFLEERYLVLIPKPREITSSILFNIEEIALKIAKKLTDYELEPKNINISIPMVIKHKKSGLESFISTEAVEKEMIGDMNYVSLVEYYRILNFILSRINTKIHVGNLKKKDKEEGDAKKIRQISSIMNSKQFYGIMTFLESTGYYPRIILENISGSGVKSIVSSLQSLKDFGLLANSITEDIIKRMILLTDKYPINRPFFFNSFSKYPNMIILDKGQEMGGDFIIINYEKLDDISKILVDESVKKTSLKFDNSESIKIGKIWKRYKVLNTSTLFDKNEIATNFYEAYFSLHRPEFVDFSMAVAQYFFDITSDIDKISLHVKCIFPSQKWYVSTIYSKSEIKPWMQDLVPVKIKRKGEELFETEPMQIEHEHFNLKSIDGLGDNGRVIEYLRANLKKKMHYLIIGSSKTHKFEIADAIARDKINKEGMIFDIFSQYIDATWSNPRLIDRKINNDANVIMIDNVNKLLEMKEKIEALINRTDKTFIFISNDAKFLTPPDSIFQVKEAKEFEWTESTIFKNLNAIEKKYGKSTALKIKKIWDAEGNFPISLISTRIKMFKLLEQKDILSYKNLAIVLPDDDET